MKRRVFIGLLLLIALTACHSPEVPPSYLGSPLLQSIDSLLQQQPDSALQCLLACQNNADDTLGDVSGNISTAFDRHYCQLLLAEAFYKNDFAQANREELLQAVAYFDSLCCKNTAHHVATDPTIAFLTARAHYINGVGHYEQDSIVEACKEYMKALETMESHFDEKELVGQKARFMALTYTHLTTLFSDLYLHDQAISFSKLSLAYFEKYNTTPWHVAWVLEVTGSHYEMKNQFDSASCYYRKAANILADSCDLMYRDIASHQALLDYKLEKDAEKPLRQLYNLVNHSEDKTEFLSRCAIIGEIFYHEAQYDSAWVYLNKVFLETSNSGVKKQAAEWLVEICKTQGRDSETKEYADFLVPFANLNENQSHLKSQLTALFRDYEKEKQEMQHRQMTRKIMMKAGGIIGVLASVFLVGFIVYHFSNKKRHQHLEAEKTKKEMQLEAERQAHKMHQAALAGRLKQSNEALRLQKEKTENLLKELETKRQQTCWSQLDDFLDEDICKEIMEMLKGKDIKREAKCGDYPELRLNPKQLSQLAAATEKHFGGLCKSLTDLCPKISRDEMNQCLLYLLNAEDVQIAALLNCDYSTVKKRSAKLKKAFGTEKDLLLFIRGFVL